MFPRTPDLLNAICNEIKLKEWKDKTKKEAKEAKKAKKKPKLTNNTIILKTSNNRTIIVEIIDVKDTNTNNKETSI